MESGSPMSTTVHLHAITIRSDIYASSLSLTESCPTYAIDSLTDRKALVCVHTTIAFTL